MATARGAAYELEVAYDLAQAGETVIKIGGDRIPLIDKVTGKIINTFDVDIVTATKMIECKRWDWEKLSAKELSDRLGKLEGLLPELKKLALSNNKVFEFHSKFAIPNNLKEYMKRHDIQFYEELK